MQKQIKLIQKTISKLNDKNLPSNENTVTEHLTQKEGFTEVIAKETIEKALKIGAITKNDLDELCLQTCLIFIAFGLTFLARPNS